MPAAILCGGCVRGVGAGGGDGEDSLRYLDCISRARRRNSAPANPADLMAAETAWPGGRKYPIRTRCGLVTVTSRQNGSSAAAGQDQ